MNGRTTIWVKQGSALERLLDKARAEGPGISATLHELAAKWEAAQQIAANATVTVSAVAATLPEVKR